MTEAQLLEIHTYVIQNSEPTAELYKCVWKFGKMFRIMYSWIMFLGNMGYNPRMPSYTKTLY
jgi:hypothetical protein